jgi:hypothetical protein
MPDPTKLVADITAGPDGALWFTEGPGEHIGHVTANGTITEFSVPGVAGNTGAGAAVRSSRAFTIVLLMRASPSAKLLRSVRPSAGNQARRAGNAGIPSDHGGRFGRCRGASSSDRTSWRDTDARVVADHE